MPSPACNHAQARVAVLTQTDGRTAFVRQCSCCGQNLGAVKKSSLSGAEQSAAPPFDHSLREDWWSECREQSQLEREAAREGWLREYSEYLLTDEWRRRRAAALRRDGFTCQGCLSRPATQVHHLTYARVGREMLFDLVSVCDECHGQIHQRDEVA